MQISRNRQISIVLVVAFALIAIILVVFLLIGTPSKRIDVDVAASPSLTATVKPSARPSTTVTVKPSVQPSATVTPTVTEPKTITEAIAAGVPFTAGLKTVKNYGTKTVSGVKYYVSQGIASDGTYFYFILKSAKDSGAIIVKTNLKGKEIACSKRLDLGHANDMTYDSQNKRLVIVHGTSSSNTSNGNDNGRRLTFVNPDTLKDTHTEANIIPSGYAAGAIAYHSGENRFYISRGGNAFRILSISEDYTVTGIMKVKRASEETEKSADYTAQGMGTDGTYIYFPMSGEKNNIVVVYTRDAQYVTTFKIPTTMESESLVFVNGKMYICFYSNGAVIAEVTFSI